MTTEAKKLRHEDYSVAWVCALPVEMAMAKAMLDERHPDLPTTLRDSNNYILGRIHVHNVVIACLPSGIYGTSSAATVATQMLSTFGSIRFGLMVGIGGGVPSALVDIRLGDVVVSKPTNAFGGVIQYDFGKTVGQGRIEQASILNKPPQVLLSAVARLQADHMLEKSQISDMLFEMADTYPQAAGKFIHLGQEQDMLFESTYDHIEPRGNCDECDPDKLVRRPARPGTSPLIHYGLIASGNQVMKHGGTRDKLAQELGILCFEMEAAGLMDSFPCLVIRGVSDYADSHKNKLWQDYAAATAAAYTKELLLVIPANQVADTPTASSTTEGRTSLTYTSGLSQISALSQGTVDLTMMEPAEFDWAGRGRSHVHFEESETLPLLQGRFLGHGMNGGVYETVCNGLSLAWKRRYCHKQIVTNDLRELEILKRLNHRHIIKLIGTYTQGPFLGLLLWPVAVCDLGTFLEDVDTLISKEFTAGDVSDINSQNLARRLGQLGLMESHSLEATRWAALTRLKKSVGCISGAIAYLHRNGVRHKDIKPSNILISANGLWITDFGSSTDFSLFSQSVTLNGERGTPKYFAPEVAQFEPNGRPADIFSLGCVFLEIICLCNGYSLKYMRSLRPEKDLSFQANLQQLLNWFNFSGTATSTPMDQQLMAVVREMIAPVPRTRSTADDIERRLKLIDALKPSHSMPLWGECCKPLTIQPPSSSTESHQSHQSNHERLSSVTISIGNLYKKDDSRHLWKFFINITPLEGLLSAIHVFLHPSFAKPYLIIHQPPFEVNGGGWGFFTISILIALQSGYCWIHPDASLGPKNQSLLPLQWTLNFEQQYSCRQMNLEIEKIFM